MKGIQPMYMLQRLLSSVASSISWFTLDCEQQAEEDVRTQA
jgi:hypothetical protein